MQRRADKVRHTHAATIDGMESALFPAAPRRVISVDVLRGITIAFLIQVNDPCDGRHTYAQR